MTITTATLSRAAALAAVAAGVLFIAIQPLHPAEELDTVTSGAWAVTGTMTIAFAVLALVGITGIYLRQVREVGVLGLVGYVLLSVMFLLTTAFAFTETLVVPLVADDAPQFVEGFLGIFSGTASEVDLGVLGAMGLVSFAAYLFGGAVLGYAMYRAHVLSRWASLALVVAATVTLLVPLLPHAVGRYAAVPMGIALIWLGQSLWADRSAAAVGMSGSGSHHADVATAGG